MQMIETRLRPDAVISLEYSDDSVLGGTMTPKFAATMREVFSTVHQVMIDYGPACAVEMSEPLLREVRNQSRYRNLLDKNDDRRVAAEVLYPQPEFVKPFALDLIWADGNERLGIDTCQRLPALHSLIAALCGEDLKDLMELSTDSQSLYREVIPKLEQGGLLVPSNAEIFAHEVNNRSNLRNCDLTFIGHNTVVVRSPYTQVVIDPWLLPVSPDTTYQPVRRAELGKIDAIIITHSHPDHFDPNTLFQFGRDVKVIVPFVERESLLAIDMAFRARELGFNDVQALKWWEEIQIGDIHIAALPFYGEQPTTSDQLCPEVRNLGNTYLIRTPKFSCAFIADSGRDREGDVRDVALEAYRRWGAIDTLFAGYRGWCLYPIQYVQSSVSCFLLFVPPELYTVRQSIMNNISEAVDTAETWHARYFVPYANGGAPWYWERGLGPVLSCDENVIPGEWLFFDPLPDRCLKELRLRSAPTPETFVGSRVLPLMLTPGQSVRLVKGEAHVVESECHRWPRSSTEPAIQEACDEANFDGTGESRFS